MDIFYRLLVSLHGLIGLVALVTFWLAAFAKKGSPLHLRTGKVYMAVMLGIIATAMPMAIVIGLRGHAQNALFLAYLVVITATGVWLGWRAVKRKRDQTGFRSAAYVVVAILNLLAAAVVLATGLKANSTLLAGFSVVGFVGGLQMLARRIRPLAETRWWLREHFSAMIGCGVATHIAFLGIGMGRVIAMLGLHAPSWYGLIAWFLPLVLSAGVGIHLNRKYFPKRTAGAPVMARA